MRLHLVLSSALSLCFTVTNAQIITVTTHISACSATYPLASTTTVPTTVTLQPTPWTDAMANSGTPFIIRVEQTDSSGYPDESTTPYWLMENGNTTTNASIATVYRISSGELTTYNGSYISTDYGVLNEPFAVSQSLEPISTTFSVSNYTLYWNNTEFSNGTAQFYKLPAGLLDNAQILAKFIGSMEPARSWSPVVLLVDPGTCNDRHCSTLAHAHLSQSRPLSFCQAQVLYPSPLVL